MKICVLGWYYDSEFMQVLENIHHKYPVQIVAHRPNETTSLPIVLIDNIGLEFGGYDYYVKNLWDGKDSVFFTHDDTLVVDIEVFDKIAQIDKDLSFLFYNKRESLSCMGAHGRSFFCSARFLQFVKTHKCKCDYAKEDGDDGHTGFYFDKKNLGNVRYDGEVIMDYTMLCNGDSYNRGIKHLYQYLRQLKSKNHLMEKPWRFGEDILPDYQYGYRGTVGIDALVKEVNNLIKQDDAKLKRLYKPLSC